MLYKDMRKLYVYRKKNYSVDDDQEEENKKLDRGTQTHSHHQINIPFWWP